jgi:anti-sigma B factor antagonist
MNIERRDHTLSIGGLRELTAANAQSVREQACAAVTPELETIELDLSETTMLDSFGLGAIASLYKTASERSRNGPPSVRLLHPQPSVQQVLELTRLHHLFEIVLRNGHEPVNVGKQTSPATPSL